MSAPSSSAPLGGSREDQLSSMLFTSSQFSVAAYLNLALGEESLAPPTPTASTSGDSDQEQRRMAELALQLQLQTQSCHEDIGRIGAELQAVLPRCAADVGRIGVGLEGMRMDAQTLLESAAVADEQQELSSSLETLSTLHALQSNLSSAKEVLTAAATWDSTMNSIPPLLAQQNLTESVNALKHLENGERALRGMPLREERQQSIAEIRQQVQVLLQPQLRHALQHMSTRLAPLQQCVAMYDKLGKMDSLREEYVKIRPGPIHKAWFAYNPSFGTDPGEGPASAQKPSNEFANWLPNWYDNLLSFLAEERRQSSSVFGQEMAPEMVVKVMRECFRPILPSFRSRLETLFSSDPSAPSKGSFEVICSVYESTLQFLSLAYELVIGAFLDLPDSVTSKKGNNGTKLYNDLLAVFRQMASPFSNYLQNFHELERKNLIVATDLVFKDMNQAVSSISSSNSNLAVLQDATENLKGLAPFIFPLVDGALQRFELLNGGYRVELALGTVDQILCSHVKELIISIRTLSAALTSDGNNLAELFDEQYVLCTMEVLKLAGTFKRDLSFFIQKSRDRLSILADRMLMHAKLDIEATKSSSFGSGTKQSGGFSVLPESLSAVELNGIITKSYCTDTQEAETAAREDEDGVETDPALGALQRLSSVTASTIFAENATDQSPPVSTLVALYPQVDEAMSRFAGSCHSFIFHVCSAVPEKHLRDVPEMTAWREGAPVDEYDSYGTLPQQYITQVGEHMLALVQAFEPFAADQTTLSLANEVMDGVRQVAIQPWSEFLASAGILGSEELANTLMDGKELSTLVLNNFALTEEDAELEEGSSEAERASAAFCNSWLDVVGMAVTGRLLERLMRIPQLTQKGCEHMSSDLNYLVNVFSALGVAGHPHPLVSHVAELASLGEDELRDHIASRNKGVQVEEALRCVEAKLALIRGVNIP